MEPGEGFARLVHAPLPQGEPTGRGRGPAGGLAADVPLDTLEALAKVGHLGLEGPYTPVELAVGQANEGTRLFKLACHIPSERLELLSV